MVVFGLHVSSIFTFQIKSEIFQINFIIFYVMHRLAQPSIIHFQAIDIHAIFAVFSQNEFVI